MITFITSVEVPVSNLDKALSWYTEILQFQVMWRDEQSAFIALPGEGTRLFLVQTNDEKRLEFTNTNTGVVHSVIDFYVENLPAFHAFLKQHGVEVTELQPKAMGFGFRDPDGNFYGAHIDQLSYQYKKNPTISSKV
ncbi:VOC family protein [Aneurinibacillus aneurinilyticus]|uniref:Glyoxalase family protein n=1 Tax=Aneurinibacillus aneurinilyticus ATCC 12856 TaxID=649747 RepID=U1X2T7_ANEAE|nr:VOC family protein [Aneurinibacillus aneurinilyticus]ERI09265.1 glyoxalase family protein [Aneurinibacillus aneurinilyticus ATCC 12856]MED0704728.1 VOC family protein [Aneurinibacillus aneurinilyticus]MED0726235.1 VOC family protein [Aneurinibacillus aneurinilyticus]MED0735095.1 VOC family protein [Aneurinibacillus aneurinilyticus]MED0744096.1 VOC family protein [Aneurinibacillus aneurinilyticus]